MKIKVGVIFGGATVEHEVRDVYKRQALDAVEKELEIRQVKAPVKKGDVVGKAVYRLNGQEIGSVRLISSQEVRKAGYGDALKKAAGYLIAGVRL